MTKIEDLKLKNTNIMKECFLDAQIWTKNALSLKTGISKTATTNILKELLEKQVICYIGEACSTGGRKSKQYQINKDYFHVGRIVLQRKKEQYILSGQSVNLFGQIVVEKDMISHTGSYQELVNLIQHLLINDSSISILCLSIPGICENGYISDCDFDKLQHIELKKCLTHLFHKKVIIENDVNVAAIGLHHLFGMSHLALLYQPEVEYVGCGMIINNQLYNGFSHFAGELRYLPFYNHQIQDDMLKSQPEELLRLQIETICCVMNPEIICLCSDVLSKEKLEALNFQLPKQHLPQIQIIDCLNEYLYEGLYDIAINSITEEENAY